MILCTLTANSLFRSSSSTYFVDPDTGAEAARNVSAYRRRLLDELEHVRQFQAVDDANVRPVSERDVRNEEAYLLPYSRREEA